MSDNYIIDCQGFEVYHKTEEKNDTGISCAFYNSWQEKDRNSLNDIEEETYKELLYLFDRMIELDKSIECGIRDQIIGQPPIYVGWCDLEKATQEKLDALQKLLQEVGFIVKRIDKDRYVTCD
jgi:GH18 family chitinase